MDRILEIDEKNMFAVIEPYVIGATLQAEVMKVGLNTHIIGAGSELFSPGQCHLLHGTWARYDFYGLSAMKICWVWNGSCPMVISEDRLFGVRAWLVLR